MEQNYKNNNKKYPCPYFALGTCRYQNDGDCNGHHAFCKNGDDCSFSNCKFMHPHDPGFKKTCKKSYFMCKYKLECEFAQHPNQNYIYPEKKDKDNYNDDDENGQYTKRYHNNKYYEKGNKNHNKEEDKNDQEEIVKKYKQLNNNNHDVSVSSSSIIIRKEKEIINEKNVVDNNDGDQEKMEYMKKEIEQIIQKNIQQFKEYFDKKINDILYLIKTDENNDNQK